MTSSLRTSMDPDNPETSRTGAGVDLYGFMCLRLKHNRCRCAVEMIPFLHTLV